jgi:hypothetical protein
MELLTINGRCQLGHLAPSSRTGRIRLECEERARDAEATPYDQKCSSHRMKEGSSDKGQVSLLYVMMHTPKRRRV